MKSLNMLFAAATLFLLSGCAEIDFPTPGRVLQQPLGPEAVKIGMTRSNVRALWGEPAHIDPNGADEAGRPREVWTYTARYTAVPVDAGYLSKTKYVYFDGNNVTRVSP